MESLCRDCAKLTRTVDGACQICGGRRVIHHPKLRSLSIAHIDCDAFYAAIEKRDNPDLKDKPVLVGGGQRGVVSTCCYIARLYGIHSAMPMFKALKACPDAIVIRPDYEKYSAAARVIREKMQRLTPLVQVVSIDEAYLDLSGTERLNGAAPAETLAQLALDIEEDVGITISIGLSENKSLAKTASEMDKPRGFSVICSEEAAEFLAPHPPNFLHGVGPKLANRLIGDGYRTIAALQHADPKSLIRKYGETGLWLHERAQGHDRRPVEPRGERKSVSSETTFGADLHVLQDLEDRLWHLCVRTADRAKSAEVEGRVVTLKLKTRDFKSYTRRVSLTAPTQLAQTLFRAAQPLLAREADGRRFRLIGIGLSDLAVARGDAPDLLDPRIAKRAAAERAADIAREKFGKTAVRTGRGVRLDRR
ncbi:MAG: DNA polymerase IV [Pseudomonadota bacterium]